MSNTKISITKTQPSNTNNIFSTSKVIDSIGRFGILGFSNPELICTQTTFDAVTATKQGKMRSHGCYIYKIYSDRFKIDDIFY
ncbi:MAG: hypothetical protein ACFCAD_07395 [Pleurocapsa sp.]